MLFGLEQQKELKTLQPLALKLSGSSAFSGKTASPSTLSRKNEKLFSLEQEDYEALKLRGTEQKSTQLGQRVKEHPMTAQ